MKIWKTGSSEGAAFGVNSGISRENIHKQGGIYVKPVKTSRKQQKTISRALDELSNVRFSPHDVIHLQNLGVNLPFESGGEAVEFLKKKNIRVMYAEFSNPDVHACLDTTNKAPIVLLNAKYKNLTSSADVLAISEAIMHETAHAKDNDSINSIQEEIDCMASNVAVHRSYERTYPGIFKDKKSALYSEGVSLYSKLFFENDPSKTGLKKRVAEKYGNLNAASPNHAASDIALEIKNISFVA